MNRPCKQPAIRLLMGAKKGVFPDSVDAVNPPCGDGWFQRVDKRFFRYAKCYFTNFSSFRI